MLQKSKSIHAALLAALLCVVGTMQWSTVISALSIPSNANGTTVATAEEQDSLDNGRNEADDDAEWDVLIFSKIWPTSSCLLLRLDEPYHECLLPNDKQDWIVHGLWPARRGKLGPKFCNKNATFDAEQLQSIFGRLMEYWPSLTEEHALDTWKHEWLKYGTCASTLASLSNELNYFEKILEIADIYPTEYLLRATDLFRNSSRISYVDEIRSELQHIASANPGIQCVYDKKRDINYLSELRLCFDKSFQWIGCDDVLFDDAVSVPTKNGSYITNCDLEAAVQYPYLRKHDESKAETLFLFTLNIYKLLKFIMWATF